MNLTERQSKILEYMLTCDERDLLDIANIVGVSVKTIRKELQHLHIILEKNRSALIRTPSKKIKFVSEYSKPWWLQKIQQSKQYPAVDVLKLYILFSPEVLTIQKIADAFFYTKSSLEKIMYTEEFKKFPIVKKRNVGLVFSGTIDFRHHLIASILTKHLHYHTLLESTIRITQALPMELLSEEQIQHIFIRTQRYLLQTEVVYTDKSWKELYIKLIIIASFKTGGKSKSTDIETHNLLSLLAMPETFTDEQVLEQFIRQLRQSSSTLKIDTQQRDDEILMNIIKEVKDKLNISWSGNEELTQQLLKHIQDTRQRLMNQDKKVNIILEGLVHDFRVKYPLAFEAGIISVDYLSQTIDTGIEDDIEAVYFGMYYQRMFDSKMTTTYENINVLIVCEHGFGVSNFIKAKVKQKFPTLHILPSRAIFEITVGAPQIELIDIIISTVKNAYFDESLEHKVVSVSPLLEQMDIDSITRKITEIKDYTFFSKMEYPIIQVNGIYKSKDQLLRDVCKELENEKYVTKDFLESVKKREALTPTAFGILAIPHGAMEYVLKTTIAIIILKKPMKWAETDVHIVCMFVATTQDVQEQKNSISNFYEHLSDNMFIEKMIQSQEKEDIIKLIMK